MVKENNVMDDLAISIVIPVYNSEKTLEKCVDSIMQQTYSNIEIILVNDGSKDKSGEICKKYQRENKNIKYISKRNGGVSSARNIGIDNSSGFFVMFVDSDDYIQPDYCENMLCAYKNSEADLIVSGYSLYANDMFQGNIVVENESLVSIANCESAIKELFDLGLMNPPYGKLFKRSLIKNKFDEQLSLGEDLLFALDYLKRCHLICIKKICGYNYICDNEGSLSNKFRENGDLIAIKLFNSSCLKCNQIWKNPESIKRVLAEKCYRNLIAYTETVIRNKGLNWREKKTLIKKCIRTDSFMELHHRKDLHFLTKHRRYAFYVQKGLYFIYFVESNFKYKLKRTFTFLKRFICDLCLLK